MDINLKNRIRDKYKIPEKYLFYPAMYLPHKNHVNLIDSLSILKLKYDVDISLVCTGSDVGYLNKIKKYAIKKKIIDNIFFLNFVDDSELPYLYSNAVALVFPVLAGPTFIPIFEAFKMEVPVLFSKLEGASTIYGDAVYYIDPLDSENIAYSIKKLIHDNKLKRNLVLNGKNKLKEVNEKNDYSAIFYVIKMYRSLAKTWDM